MRIKEHKNTENLKKKNSEKKHANYLKWLPLMGQMGTSFLILMFHFT